MGGRGFRDFANRNGIPHQRGRDGVVRTEPRVTDEGVWGAEAGYWWVALVQVSAWGNGDKRRGSEQEVGGVRRWNVGLHTLMRRGLRMG